MATPRKGRTTRTPKTDWRPAFLTALAEGMSITYACKAAGVGRSTAFEHRHRDEAFALAWHEANLAGVEKLEDEVRRRGYEGVEEPVYQGGKLVGHVRKFSDTLLIFSLKAKAPEKYRDNVKVEHAGHVATGGARELMALTDEEFAEVERVLDRAQARRADD